MKLISWNVNGLRACLGKGFTGFFSQLDADIFCIQETKMQQGQAEVDLPGYRQYWNSAEKKGYSGTAVFTRIEPLSVTYGLGIEEHDHEGRIITLEYPGFYLVNCYTPNAKRGLERLVLSPVPDRRDMARVVSALGGGARTGGPDEALAAFLDTLLAAVMEDL